MHILLLTSHSLGQAALDFLHTLDGIDYITVCREGAIKQYPDAYDIGVSFLYNHLIPAEQLTPNRLWINFHPAPLPSYRGRNVAYHAIINGEKNFGATLHYVSETFDTGAIIEQLLFWIDDGDTAGDIAEKARRKCLKLFQKWMPLLLSGVKPLAIAQGNGTYYKHAPIDPYIQLTPKQEAQIRAITADPHFAKVKIGGRDYDIRPVD